ncbi:YtcA family lipoprotein [Methylomonas sp. AM2-LC]|uniref:YtcA family lipoprotein n=1 Tax=Methylomonas sp. AM2-LC TaxID=3153301 RepID=UPI003266D8D1
MSFLTRLRIAIFLVFLTPFLAACDPLLSIEGSFWPAWIICILAGLLVCMMLMWLFVRQRLAPYLGPPLLIVPSLWALSTFIIWLLFYLN